MIGILAAGAAAWVALSLGLLRERQDWRTAVVEYTNLYTNETFSPLNPDAPLQAIELRALGARVGVNLTPESVALPGLRFTVAFMLSYNGAPLGVVAYVDPSGAPGQSVARLVVARRTEPSGDWPHPGGAGSCISANARKANLTSPVACGARGMAGRMTA
jgi:hypothetical protein